LFQLSLENHPYNIYELLFMKGLVSGTCLGRGKPGFSLARPQDLWNNQSGYRTSPIYDSMRLYWDLPQGGYAIFSPENPINYGILEQAAFFYFLNQVLSKCEWRI
jgi:hypothetical protein